MEEKFYGIDELANVSINGYDEALWWLDDLYHKKAVERIGEFNFPSAVGMACLAEIARERGFLFDRYGRFSRFAS